MCSDSTVAARNQFQSVSRRLDKPSSDEFLENAKEINSVINLVSYTRKCSQKHGELPNEFPKNSQDLETEYINIYLILQNCIESKQTNLLCSSYCYSVVGPLIQHVKEVYEKELKFDNWEAKMHEQELNIVRLEGSVEALKEIIKGKDKELATQSELIAAHADQVNIRNSELKELHELQLTIKKLEVSLTELRSSDQLQLEIIKGKDKELAAQSELIAAYKTQLTLKDDELKKLKTEEEIKKIDISDPASCSVQKSEIQEIKLNGVQSFSVLCEAGIGWIVIQRRIDASESFNRTWEDYRVGFGQLNGSFFIGLEKLHQLTTSRPHELYVYLKSSEGEWRYAQYDNFVIGNASEQYALKSLTYQSGTAGDALKDHVGMKFSTYDVDNDLNPLSCGQDWLSGWWFNDCLDR